MSHLLDILVAVPPQLLWNDRHGMPYRDIWPDKCPFRGPPKNLAVYMYAEEDPRRDRKINLSTIHSATVNCITLSLCVCTGETPRPSFNPL